MPAKDHYHDVVVRALQKNGWTIKSQQVKFVLEKRRLWIDIYASNDLQNAAILVEVKGFENMPSPIDFLANAAGKFVLYQAALEYLRVTTPLYMAVPETAYTGILSEQIGQQVIEKANIRLVLFSPESEEITKWIPTV